MLRITVGLSALALAILVSPLAVATPIQWTGLGSNGHYYELVPGSVNWSQALGVAAAHGGHLPTFASAA